MTSELRRFDVEGPVGRLTVLVLPHLELNEHLHTKPVPTP